MANFTTDGKLCIERELEINSTEKQFDDMITRFDILETCKWITDNNFLKVLSSCRNYRQTYKYSYSKIYLESSFELLSNWKEN